METIRIFSHFTLKDLLRARLKTNTYMEISDLGGVSFSTVRRWDTDAGTKFQGRLQYNLHKIFGDELFTHGLHMGKFCARQREDCKKYGCQRLAAENFGIGRTTFNAWMSGRIIPHMNYHQQIYDYYGEVVFERMKK